MMMLPPSLPSLEVVTHVQSLLSIHQHGAPLTLFSKTQNNTPKWPVKDFMSSAGNSHGL